MTKTFAQLDVYFENALYKAMEGYHEVSLRGQSEICNYLPINNKITY